MPELSFDYSILWKCDGTCFYPIHLFLSHSVKKSSVWNANPLNVLFPDFGPFKRTA
jgi:hypothetical protein